MSGEDGAPDDAAAFGAAPVAGDTTRRSIGHTDSSGRQICLASVCGQLVATDADVTVDA